LLWGTSADSLRSQNVKAAKNSSNASFYVPFLSTTTGYSQLQTTDNFYFNPSTNVLHATASSSIYADLAERYEADAVYDEGTVVVIGGEKEITVTSTFADTRVAGIVSKNPAYMMNSEAGTDETHPFIALKGRVPCKVLGPITKGDLLVTSGTLGHAQAWAFLPEDVKL
jgi:hypothetical protein